MYLSEYEKLPQLQQLPEGNHDRSEWIQCQYFWQQGCGIEKYHGQESSGPCPLGALILPAKKSTKGKGKAKAKTQTPADPAKTASSTGGSKSSKTKKAKAAKAKAKNTKAGAESQTEATMDKAVAKGESSFNLRNVSVLSMSDVTSGLRFHLKLIGLFAFPSSPLLS